MFVKICGLTTVEAVRSAVDAGADAVGFVMSARSRRAVSADTAARLREAAGEGVETVLVTDDVPAAELAGIARAVGVSAVQLHGARYDAGVVAQLRAEGIAGVWRAAAWDAEDSLRAGAWGEDVLVVDSPSPGSGEAWDLQQAGVDWRHGRTVIAGGLTPDTVEAAIAAVRPWGVDVSSGVESAPGVKDDALVAAFVRRAKQA